MSRYYASGRPTIAGDGNGSIVAIREVRVTLRPRASWGKSSLVKECYRLERNPTTGRRPKARAKGTVVWQAEPKRLEMSARDQAYLARHNERKIAGNIGNID